MLFTFTPRLRSFPRSSVGMINWLLIASCIVVFGGDAVAAAPILKTDEQWSSTGSMSTARYRYTATLLPSGKVLVAGGYHNLSSAEIYDPSTGSWSSTGAMSTGRYDHTATLLPSGKVLVAGGNILGSSLSSTELYDPSTGSWSNTGAMSTGRQWHTATLLPSGEVLVAGGHYYSGGSYYLSSAEVYDPSSGSWSSTGAMGTTRYRHTATLLPSGKVLVAGGSKIGGDYLSSAEIYDPSTSSWSSTGSMSTRRYLHTATLLPSGKVLVAGGYIRVSSAEIYDPSTGSWSSTGSMSTGRYDHTATLLPSNKVLVAGGWNGSYLSAEIYAPSSGSWSSTVSMNTTRMIHTATLLPTGKVLVAGGWRGSSLNSAELYEPAASAITAPAVSTDAPSLITATNAILKGTVNPNGAATTASFNFGITTAYGTNIVATPATIAATAGSTAVSANKTGLTCGTTYHYRVTAVNSVGSTNGADKAFTTSACPRDLIVTNITLNPAKPVAGTAFSAVVTVKNQGTTATAASKLKLWPNLATVPVCTTAASKIVDVGAIAAGASININITGLTSSVVGSNTFRAFADGTCIIGETNETNNKRTLSYRIGGRLPDLVIINITLKTDTLAKNTLFNAEIKVKNQGTVFSGPSFLDVWTNQATTANCGAVGNAWADIGALAAGASKVINLTGLNAGATAGAKTLRAFVDSWCETVESNEANNQLTKEYTVQ